MSPYFIEPLFLLALRAVLPTFKEATMTYVNDADLSAGIKLLRPKAVIRLLGISRPTLYRLAQSDPTFPSAVRLGKNSIAFVQAELMAWIDANRLSRASERGET
jgi:predicted DNA-binding transcriptional regulator AlpA